MSPSAFAALMALILSLPPTVVVCFTIGADYYMYHGGSALNESPAPIAGAGIPVLLLAGAAYLVMNRLRRKAA